MGIHFTLWSNHLAKTGKHAEITWDTLRDFVAQPNTVSDAVVKDDLEGWSPVLTRDRRRGIEFTELVSLLCFDDDKSGLPISQVREIWGQYSGLIHTTFQSRPDAPRYRIILRPTRDLTAKEFTHVRELLARRATLAGQKLDNMPTDPSRLWYSPTQNKENSYNWCELTGEPVSVDALLQEDLPEMVGCKEANGASKLNGHSNGVSAAIPCKEDNGNRKALARALAAVWPEPGHRHEAQLALAGALRGLGWSREEATEFLCDVCREVGHEAEAKREKTIENTWSKPPGSKLTAWTRLKGLVNTPWVVDGVRTQLDPVLARHEQLTQPPPSKPLASNEVQAGPFRCIRADFDKPQDPIEYLIDGFLAKSEVAMLVAHGNSLKTWLVLSQAIAIASGRPWLGEYPTQKGRVCIVDFESGAYELIRRLKLLGATNAQLEDRLLIAPWPRASLEDPATWDSLLDEKFDLLVIDSYRAAAPHVDENDAKAANILQLASEFAHRTEQSHPCSIQVLHHRRKGTGGDHREVVRGSTSLYAACDRIFELTDLESSEGNIERATVRAIKKGAGLTPADIRIELSNAEGLRKLDIEKTRQEKPKDSKKRALEILEQDLYRERGIRKSLLLDSLGERHGPTRTMLSELERASVIEEYRMGRETFIRLK